MLEYYAGQKLCIFISKNDKYEGIVLYELLLEIAFNSRLSGGTVTIGDKGFFGDQNESTRLKILRSTENLPVVLEFQGRTNRIKRYIERIQPMIKEGLLTLSDVQITKFNSPDEDTADFEGQQNEDQAKIFDEDNHVSSRPEPPQENAGETFEECERDSIKLQGDASSQPEADESVPEAQGAADDSGTPEFQTPDDDHIKKEPLDDNFEDESDVLSEAEFEADESVFQLTDLSETQAEASAGEHLDRADLDENVEETDHHAEFAKPQTDEDLDALFEEGNEQFESTFDHMLKQAGEATVGGVHLDAEDRKTVKTKPGASAGQEAGESVAATPGTDDRDHTEENMKNYFSALFKK